jgi:hypothetical protein
MEGDMSEELTRFPITPQERHESAKSSKDVAAVPDENQPRREARPQDKPLPPQHDEHEDKPAAPRDRAGEESDDA